MAKKQNTDNEWAGLLSWEEIETKQLLSNINRRHFHRASYDLSAGQIFDMASDRFLDEVELPPQGMALIITKEDFDLPENILGLTTVKNSLSIRGILALNIGIVDPGFKGPISSIVINFGRRPFTIRTGDRYLRMTFHQFHAGKIPPIMEEKGNTTHVFSRTEYANLRRLEASSQLGKTFLSLENTKNEIRHEVLETIFDKGLKLSFVFTLLIAVLGLMFKVYIDSVQLTGKQFHDLKEAIKTELVTELQERPRGVKK